MDTNVACTIAIQPLRDHVCSAMNQARLLERRSMFDTKWPHDRFSATLDGDSLFRLRVCTSAHAIEKLDRLSANEYWGLRLLNLALSFAVEFPLVESDIDAAATLLRDEALAGDRELLLRTLNDGLFDELSQTDLQTAKDCAFIITDEANPYVENQLTINPIFCL